MRMLQKCAIAGVAAACLTWTSHAGAHDTSPDACKVEDWRLVSLIAGMATIEGVTTCTEGAMQLRLYDGTGDARRFLGASTTFIEGHVFQAILADIAKPASPTIEYAITEGGW